jgi:hypothetical protein
MTLFHLAIAPVGMASTSSKPDLYVLLLCNLYNAHLAKVSVGIIKNGTAIKTLCSSKVHKSSRAT